MNLKVILCFGMPTCVHALVVTRTVRGKLRIVSLSKWSLVLIQATTGPHRRVSDDEMYYL